MKKVDVKKYLETIESTKSKFQEMVSNLEQDIFIILVQREEDFEPTLMFSFHLNEQIVDFELENVKLIYLPLIEYSIELDHKQQLATLADNLYLDNTSLEDLPTYWSYLRKNVPVYPTTESKFNSFSFGDRGIQLSIQDEVLKISQTEYGSVSYELMKEQWIEYYNLQIAGANDVIKSLQQYLKFGPIACLFNSSTRQYIKLLESHQQREDSERE